MLFLFDFFIVEGYSCQKTREVVLNYFDNADFRVVMRRFFWPVPLSRDTRFSVPRTHSIEFIRSGQVFLNHPDKTIQLTAPVLFWMRKDEMFHFSVPEGQKK